MFCQSEYKKVYNNRTSCERVNNRGLKGREKVNASTHAHILSGVLKCPCCGKSLYGNIAKTHSKDKKTRYYYCGKNTVTPTGHECTFRPNTEQTEMNRMVAAIICAMVNETRFADAIKEKIGSAVDTKDLEKRL